jgi:serine/threonine protein kinase
MAVPSTGSELLGLVRKSGVVDPTVLDAYLGQLQGSPPPDNPLELAKLCVHHGILTYFQAVQLLQGKWRGFTLGKYQILERIGIGGMGIVYLAEHKFLHRQVALKLLAPDLSNHPWFLERFYKEAQAVAALDHPSFVRIFDIDRDGQLHFLVLEYVDGSSLQTIVQEHGPMDVIRAAHYIRQSAWGLEHTHKIGLVHRDIKPGNLLLDRRGRIKILDMGLACFQECARETPCNQAGQRTIVGTDDYLAPEQVVNSDSVDIRADIYSLGATLYYLLSGRPPFHDVTLGHHKLIRHLTRHPEPIRVLRPEVPEALAAIIEKMMSKNPWERYETPTEVVEALAPWTQTPIPPPPEDEMPKLSPAARNLRFRGASPGFSAQRANQGKSWVISTGSQDTAEPTGLFGETPEVQAQTPTSISQVPHTATHNL